jgi:hypothetical protein
MKTRSRLGACIAALVCMTAAGCTDHSRNPLTPEPGTEGGGEGGVPLRVALDCRASMSAGTITCGPEAPETGGAAGDIIVGGQNTFVTLASSNLAYNSGTGQLTFNVTLRNLIEQPMGTVDGTTVSNIRVFFHVAPTVTSGTGSVAVLPDGFGEFTAPGQPYYNVPQILDRNETSAVDTWTFILPPTVNTFIFKLYVSAPVQWPDGYVTLDGLLPGADGGDLRPGVPRATVALVKDKVGRVIVGAPVTYGTSDPLCATVDPAGVVTGQRAGTCQVTATSGSLPGGLSVDVTGITRVWTGAVSADWSVGGNWTGGLTPATVDSVSIPAAAANMPALSAPVTIAGVGVADAATLTLGAQTLTVNADLFTGTSGGVLGGGAGVLALAGTGGTVRGVVPATVVTGTYGLSGDLRVNGAPQTIRAGQLRGQGYQLRIVNQ